MGRGGLAVVALRFHTFLESAALMIKNYKLHFIALGTVK